MQPQDIRINPSYLQAMIETHKMQLDSQARIGEAWNNLAKQASGMSEYFNRRAERAEDKEERDTANAKEQERYESERAYRASRDKVNDANAAHTQRIQDKQLQLSQDANFRAKQAHEQNLAAAKLTNAQNAALAAAEANGGNTQGARGIEETATQTMLTAAGNKSTLAKERTKDIRTTGSTKLGLNSEVTPPTTTGNTLLAQGSQNPMMRDTIPTYAQGRGQKVASVQ